jgi:hypothetical protein
MIGDRERTILQEVGTVSVSGDVRLADVMALCDDLGLDPTRVRLCVASAGGTGGSLEVTVMR